MASYLVATYQLENIKDGINEILENASSLDNAVLVNTKRVERVSDADNSLCGVVFTREQVDVLKKMLDAHIKSSPVKTNKSKAL